MIPGLFALIVIFGIVGAVSFLHEKALNTSASEGDGGLKAVDFDIHESTE